MNKWNHLYFVKWFAFSWEDLKEPRFQEVQEDFPPIDFKGCSVLAHMGEKKRAKVWIHAIFPIPSYVKIAKIVNTEICEIKRA